MTKVMSGYSVCQAENGRWRNEMAYPAALVRDRYQQR